MLTLPSSSPHSRRRRYALAAMGVASALPIAWVSTVSRTALIGACAAVVAAVLAVAGVWFVPAIAMPGTYLDQRVGPLQTNISVADVLVLAGAFTALLSIDWRRHPFLVRGAGAAIAYVALILPSVAVAGTLAGAVEMGHRLAIVLGGLAIGAYLQERERLMLTARVFLGASVVISALAVLDFVRSGLHAAYPLGLQKNYAGSLIASGLLMTLLFHARRRRDRALLYLTRLALFIGLGAVSSRGAFIGLLGGLVVWSAMQRRSRKLVVFLALASIPVFAFSYVQESLDNPIFGSINQHAVSLRQAVDVWQTSPIFGAGLRFFYTGNYDLNIDPHNVFVLTLAESGVIGLVGLLYLEARMGYLLARQRTTLGAVALAILLARLMHGAFDIFWVHGSQALPWMLVGAALATAPAGEEADAIVEPIQDAAPLPARAIAAR